MTKPSDIMNLVQHMELPQAVDSVKNVELQEFHNHYAELFLKKLENIRIPVSDNLWQTHLKENAAILVNATNSAALLQIKENRIPQLNKEGYPTLSYLLALNALDGLALGRTDINDDRASERFESVSQSQDDLRDAVWQGTDTAYYIKLLAKVLYQPDHKDNLVKDGPQPAIVIAQAIADAAYAAKQQALGLTQER